MAVWFSDEQSAFELAADQKNKDEVGLEWIKNLDFQQCLNILRYNSQYETDIRRHRIIKCESMH